MCHVFHQIWAMFICIMFLHGHDAMFKVVNDKPFKNLFNLWELARFFLKKHITHLMSCIPYMSTSMMLSFNKKKTYDFATWWNKTQKLSLMMSCVNYCFQNAFSLVHHFSLITPSTYNTSSNKEISISWITIL
jgi:hypothetical protein